MTERFKKGSPQDTYYSWEGYAKDKAEIEKKKKEQQDKIETEVTTQGPQDEGDAYFSDTLDDFAKTLRMTNYYMGFFEGEVQKTLKLPDVVGLDPEYLKYNFLTLAGKELDKIVDSVVEYFNLFEIDASYYKELKIDFIVRYKGKAPNPLVKVYYEFDILSALVPTKYSDRNSPEKWERKTKEEINQILVHDFMVEPSTYNEKWNNIQKICSSFTTRHFLFWYVSLRDNFASDAAEQNRKTTDWMKFTGVYYRPVVGIVYKKGYKYNLETKKNEKLKDQDDGAVKDLDNKKKILEEEQKKKDPILVVDVAGVSEKELFDLLNRVDYRRILGKLQQCISKFAGVSYLNPEIELPSLTPYSAPSISLPSLPVFDPSKGMSQTLTDKIWESVKKSILDKIKKSFDVGEFDCKDLEQLADRASLKAFKDFFKNLPQKLKNFTEELWEEVLKNVRDDLGIDFCMSLDDFTNVMTVLPDYVLPEEMLNLFGGISSQETLLITRDIITEQLESSQYCSGINDIEIVRDLFYNVGKTPELEKVLPPLRDVLDAGNINDYSAGNIACVSAYEALAEWLRGQGLTEEKINCLLLQDKTKKLESLAVIGELLETPEVSPELNTRELEANSEGFVRNLRDLYDTNFQVIFSQLLENYKKFNEYMLGKTSDTVDGPIDVFDGISFESPNGQVSIPSGVLDDIKKTTKEAQGYVEPDASNPYVNSNYGQYIKTDKASNIIERLKLILGILKPGIKLDIQNTNEIRLNTKYAVDAIKIDLKEQHTKSNNSQESNNFNNIDKIYEDGYGDFVKYESHYIQSRVTDSVFGDIAIPQKTLVEQEEFYGDANQELSEFLDRYGITVQSGKNYDPQFSPDGELRIGSFDIGERISPHRNIFEKIINKTGKRDTKTLNYFRNNLYNSIWQSIFDNVMYSIQKSRLIGEKGNQHLQGVEVFGLMLKNMDNLSCIVDNFEIFNYSLSREKFVQMFKRWYGGDENVSQEWFSGMGLVQYIIRIKIIEFIFKNLYVINYINYNNNDILFKEIENTISEYKLNDYYGLLYDCYVYNQIIDGSFESNYKEVIKYELGYLIKQFKVLIGDVENNIYSLLSKNLSIYNLENINSNSFDVMNSVIENQLPEESTIEYSLGKQKYHTKYTTFFWRVWGRKGDDKRLIQFADSEDPERASFSRIYNTPVFELSSIKELDEIGFDYNIGWFQSASMPIGYFSENNFSRQYTVIPDAIVLGKDFIGNLEDGNIFAQVKQEFNKEVDKSKLFMSYLKDVLRIDLISTITVKYVAFILSQYWDDKNYRDLFESVLSYIELASEYNNAVIPTELMPLPQEDPSVFSKANNDSDTFGLIKSFLADTPIKKMAAKMAIEAPKLIFKSMVEYSDPNIRVARPLVDAAKIAGVDIPIASASLGLLLPVNIAPVIGWGPPITPAGLAYLGLETLEERKGAGEPSGNILASNAGEPGSGMSDNRLMSLIDSVFSIDRICEESQSLFETLPAIPESAPDKQEIEQCQNLYL